MSKERKEYIDFLIDISFVGKINGDNSEICHSYKKAINNAYRDLQRTIKYKKLGKTDKEVLDFKNKCREIIGSSLDELLKIDSVKKESFDKWHKNLCISLRNQDNILTIGQAQKWVNMTLKNLCILEEFEYEDLMGFQSISCYFHVPIDAYIIAEAGKKAGLDIDIKKEIRNSDKYNVNASWSKWNCYDSYQLIQDAFREMIRDETPFEWELSAWKRSRGTN